MKTQFILISFLVLTASLGNAVSRIGGGKVQSLSSGFEMNISGAFQVGDVNSDSVRCLGPVAMINYGTTPSIGSQFFDIAEFAREFSDAVNLSANNLVTRFEKSGWVRQPAQTCSVVLRLRTDGVVAYIVTWGSGKGFVMKGTPTAQTEETMREALSSLKINGGCAWK